MALVFGAAAAACSFGVVDCDFSSEGSYPTVDIDQCEEADKQLKEEYGDKSYYHASYELRSSIHQKYWV